jgi:Signal transduction histidine kinase regulating C4-dicarboxylate transport system
MPDKMTKYFFLGLLALLLESSVCFSKNMYDGSLTVYDSGHKALLIKHRYIYIDDLSKDGITDAAKKTFRSYNGGILNAGFISKNLWVRFDVKNSTSNNELYIKIDQPVIESMELYEKVSDTSFMHYEQGAYQLFDDRFAKSPNYIFPVQIEKNTVKTFYLKIKSANQIQMPIYVGTRDSIIEQTATQEFFLGIYIGIVFIMIFYNAFIFISAKDVSYIYYIVFIIFIGLTQSVLKGYAYQFLWHNFPALARESILIMPCLAGIYTGIFMQHFLQTKKYSAVLHSGINVFIALYCIDFLIGIYKIQHGIIATQITSSLALLYTLMVGWILTRKGYRVALFFLMAYCIFLISIIASVLCNSNFIPYNNFTSNILEVGSAIQITLLSFALADKINHYREEQNKARQEALAISKENERLITEQNAILEKQVQSRTTQLLKANDELTNAVDKLKSTQTQLVEFEKMASFGQISAGVAHEINNPINFVASNVKPLELDMKDIYEVLDKYGMIDIKGDITHQLKEIEEFKTQIDIEYIKSEINILLSGIKDGAQRTAEIVSNLKNFSRIDQLSMKYADINEGIESTLILVRNTFPKNMNLIKNLGKLPPVECVPGKINQVFMNLISNAIHALKVKKFQEGSDSPTLAITTWQEGNKVKISVKDNGTGMGNEVKAKIFDPFFTTKDVGEGTGLGMSIVKGIVDSHKAEIEVYTELGIGTEFILSLLVKSFD